MSATGSYFEREKAFYKVRQDLDAILDHPDFEAPDHPYIEQIRALNKYAIFGIIDTANGLLHPGTAVFADTVVIAPVLDRDMKVGRVSVSSALLRDPSQDEVFDFSSLSSGSGVCDASGWVVCPIVSLAPYMHSRHPYVVGPTILHELDHAYWWLRRKSKFKHYDPETDECIAAQEVSANRLEQQAYFALTPELYDIEFGNISLRYADHDFQRRYVPRDHDKVRKAVKVCAFINYMFDSLGADVGVHPSSDLILALKAQGLM